MAVFGVAIPPMLFPHGSLQGVLQAKAAGQAKFDAVAPTCPATDPSSSHELTYYFTIRP